MRMMTRDLEVSLSISDDEVRDFAAIWKSVFAEELPLANARTIAARLVALYSLLAKPLPDRIAQSDEPRGSGEGA